MVEIQKDTDAYFFYNFFQKAYIHKWAEWPDAKDRMLDLAGTSRKSVELLLELAKEEVEKKGHPKAWMGVVLQEILMRIMRDRAFVPLKHRYHRKFSRTQIGKDLIPAILISKQYLQSEYQNATSEDMREYFKNASVAELTETYYVNEKIAKILKTEMGKMPDSTYTDKRKEGMIFFAAVVYKAQNDKDYISEHWAITAHNRWSKGQEKKHLLVLSGDSKEKLQQDKQLLIGLVSFLYKEKWHWVVVKAKEFCKTLKEETDRKRIAELIEQVSLSFGATSPSIQGSASA